MLNIKDRYIEFLIQTGKELHVIYGCIFSRGQFCEIFNHEPDKQILELNLH